MKKKTITLVIISVVLIAATFVAHISGAFSFLYDTKAKDNNFSVNQIKVAIEEYKTGADNIKEEWVSPEYCAPGEVISKEPCIINSGEHNIIVYMILKSPKGKFTEVNSDDSTVVKTNTEYYEFINNDISWNSSSNEVVAENTRDVNGAPNLGQHWRLIESDVTSSSKFNYYVYSYDTVLSSVTNNETYSETLNTPFQRVQLKNYEEGTLDKRFLDIGIETFALPSPYEENNASVALSLAQDKWNEFKTVQGYKFSPEGSETSVLNFTVILNGSEYKKDSFEISAGESISQCIERYADTLGLENYSYDESFYTQAVADTQYDITISAT